MNLDIGFIPEKLIESGDKIELRHNQKNSYVLSGSDEELKNLIMRLEDIPADMSQAAALSLSDREADMLAGYVPYNFFALPQEKLFQMLKYRLNKRNSNVLFNEWQEEFGNPGCNEFLKDLACSSIPFRELLHEKHIDSDVFVRILESRSIPLEFDLELVGGSYSDGGDFEDKLGYYGVIPQSYLDIECKRALLAFCSKEDYFNCSEENLVEIIKTYDEYMLKRFVHNFMDKLSLAELQSYPAVAAYLRQSIGQRYSRVFESFFADTDPQSIQKFIDWINVYKINLYFEYDERSSFWKQYRYVNVTRYPVSNVVVMETENCFLVEFLGEKKGTIYVCGKDVFMSEFYTRLDAMDNEDLRMYFKEHRDICIEYRNHTGRWQSHMSNIMLKRGIAEKIKI